jgi:drug/metabolite transporter (DMT)-like permease
VWGSSFLVTKIGVTALPPFMFSSVRFMLGGAMLYAIAQWLRPAPVRPERADWWHALVVGSATVLVSNGANVWALQWISSNQSALLNVSSAFWIALFGVFGRRGQPISLRVGIGLAVGGIGTALILIPRDPAMATSAHGTLLPSLVVLGGCMAWGMGSIYLRNVRARVDLLTFTGMQMLCGGALLQLPALLNGDAAAWHWSAGGVAAMAYLTIFSSCLAYTAFAWLLQNATPALTGSYGFVNPAIATLLGWLVLDERLQGAQVTGMVVIIIGVLLVNWPDPARTR